MEYFTKFGITIQKVPQQVLYSGIPTKVGDDIYALIKNGKEVFRGTKREIDELAEKLKKMSDKEAKKYLDDLIGEIKNFNRVPSIKGFTKWFDNIPLNDFMKLWKQRETQEIIKRRIRHPGGLHEWLMVSRTDVFKKWGVSMTEIKQLRTKIEYVIFKNPPGRHGGFGSTKAHNEILEIIDNSSNYKDFKNKLIDWANNRLEGGANSLPKNFFDK